MKLNLGCGNDVKPGWVNCDYYVERDDVQKVNLNKLPLPFGDGVADEIVLSHVLEHVYNQYDLVMDCHRILRKGGVLHVRLPIHSNRIEHISFYHQKNFLDIFFRNYYHSDGIADFELLSLKKHINPCRARIRERYYRLLSWIHSLIFIEYYWVMRKK